MTATRAFAVTTAPSGRAVCVAFPKGRGDWGKKSEAGGTRDPIIGPFVAV